jgi:A/G-specific DNA glycosylase
MRRWPTVEELATASEDEVLREWQGLGYYSRARNLHTAAKQIVEMGGFPRTLEGIKQLKGVGDYTAAAIGSIAFDLPAAVVDGNVYRVLARHYGISTPINTTEGKKEFTALAQSLLPVKQASAFNQAMMDFGAIQCTPSTPQCPSCPLQETCIALREGRVNELPVKQKTLKVKERHLTYVYIRYQGKTAIHRRGEGDIWQGLYEPWLTDKVPCGAILIRQNVKHVLTHRVLYADFWLWEPDQKPVLPADYLWIKEADIDQYGVPRLIEILLNNLKK